MQTVKKLISLRQNLAEGLRIHAFNMREDESAIVRQALSDYLREHGDEAVRAAAFPTKPESVATATEERTEK